MPSKRAQENARSEVAIQGADVRTRQTYGPERLHDELKDEGFLAGIGRIKLLRKKLGLRCTQVRSSKPPLGSEVDHMHLHTVIPPPEAVVPVVGMLKSVTSARLKDKFPHFLRKVYWDGRGIWG